MRLLIASCILLFAACGHSGHNSSDKDSKTVKTDSSSPPGPDTTATSSPAGSDEINSLLVQKGEGKWHLVTDKETGWMPDVVEYFVIPERKKNPEYPFIARGDFDCDKVNDIAALVTDSGGKKTRLIFFLGSNKQITWWGEDIQGAALMSIPPGEVGGFEGDLDNGKKVTLACNGVEAVWYEKSSYVVYWNGRKFANLWTSD